jgi:hypothetical protein
MKSIPALPHFDIICRKGPHVPPPRRFLNDLFGPPVASSYFTPKYVHGCDAVYSVGCYKFFAGIYCLLLRGLIRIPELYPRMEVVISSPKCWLNICVIILEFLYLRCVIQGLNLGERKKS